MSGIAPLPSGLGHFSGVFDASSVSKYYVTYAGHVREHEVTNLKRHERPSCPMRVWLRVPRRYEPDSL